nr:MAG TPA: hypothetical protein [Caudoviricetes sp.]
MYVPGLFLSRAKHPVRRWLGVCAASHPSGADAGDRT